MTTTPAVNAPLGDGTGQLAAAAVVTPVVAAVVADPAAVVADPAAVVADPAKPVLADPAKIEADAKAAEKATALTAAEKAVTEAKTPEEKAAATRALAELKDTPGVAPEKYEAFLLPDGMTPDPAQHEAASTIFKELGLSQLQAQKLVDFEAKRTVAAAQQQTQAWNTLMETRNTELRNDPEIGGAKYDQSIADARAFIKAYGSTKLQDYLNSDAAGSHPELIRAMAKAGRAVSDDTLVAGGKAPAGTGLTQAQKMYPTMR